METGKEHYSGGSEGGNIRVEEVMETGKEHSSGGREGGREGDLQSLHTTP